MVEKLLCIRLAFVLSLVVLLVLVSGCGKRGFPISTSDKEVYYPKTYPTH
jgi:hypothetical protein